MASLNEEETLQAAKDKAPKIREGFSCNNNKNKGLCEFFLDWPLVIWNWNFLGCK